MAYPLIKKLFKFMLPFLIICMIFQVSADKEPHEESSENDSVID